MIAYKGFSKQLKSVMGDGDKRNCQFHLGETKRVETSKTVRSGFHCCENPFECLAYYSFNESRFFKVEAAGDIDEDGNERIACTEITLLEELTPLQFALEGMRYMIMHPERANWQQSYSGVNVLENECEAVATGNIAIARGINPCVKGPAGSILGLIVDNGREITGAKLLIVDEKQAMKWLYLSSERSVKELEEKED